MDEYNKRKPYWEYMRIDDEPVQRSVDKEIEIIDNIMKELGDLKNRLKNMPL